MSDNNVKYINFKYIILAPPSILIKIRHCRRIQLVVQLATLQEHKPKLHQ